MNLYKDLLFLHGHVTDPRILDDVTPPAPRPRAVAPPTPPVPRRRPRFRIGLPRLAAPPRPPRPSCG